ncbi:hypothetical protein [Thermotoga sp. SG1]|uniref:hypothetical protein n=1 Tax=Thermotoga sp. SG1 TaxID=126739 RepID=UPI000C77FDCE|nr:hypothetical protein [Thermotoga sp. SG1]PLV55741.1 hypothetical protein AS006_08905 [Thermotoga sp. SG1]
MTARIDITAYHPNGFTDWVQEVELDAEDILYLISQLSEKERLMIVRVVLKQFSVKEIQRFFREFF